MAKLIIVTVLCLFYMVGAFGSFNRNPDEAQGGFGIFVTFGAIVLAAICHLILHT